MLDGEDGTDSGEAEVVARALLKRAASDAEPMLLVKAAEMLLRHRPWDRGRLVVGEAAPSVDR